MKAMENLSMKIWNIILENSKKIFSMEKELFIDKMEI
jgi:hypothetical protein